MGARLKKFSFKSDKRSNAVINKFYRNRIKNYFNYGTIDGSNNLKMEIEHKDNKSDDSRKYFINCLKHEVKIWFFTIGIISILIYGLNNAV